MNIRSILLAAATLLICFIPVWIIVITPELKSIPPGYNAHIEFLGVAHWTDPGKETTTIIMHELHTEKAIQSSGSMIDIEMETVAQNLISEEIFWQSKETLSINRKTKKYTDQDTYFFFPIHLRKESIEKMKFYSYLPVATYHFEREESIDGINVYVFSYDIPAIESTEFYPAWLSENKRILMNDWGWAWIEPVSGHVVNAEDNWDAYLADNPDVHIDTGRIKYTEDTIHNQARIAQNKKQAIILYEILFPSLIGLIALAFIISVLINAPRRIKNW